MIMKFEWVYKEIINIFVQSRILTVYKTSIYCRESYLKPVNTVVIESENI